MFNKAPVAFRCTLISFDFASLVRGPSAPDLAILALFSSWVARFVMQPTALHCTSTFGDIICRMRGERPPSNTIETLFSAAPNTSVTCFDSLGIFGADHSLPGCPMLRLLLAAPPHRDFEGEIGWVRGSRGQLLLHLRKVLNDFRIYTDQGGKYLSQ